MVPSANRPFATCPAAAAGDTCLKALDGNCDYQDSESTERSDCADGTDETDCGRRRSLGAEAEITTTPEGLTATSKPGVLSDAPGPLTEGRRLSLDLSNVCYNQPWQLSNGGRGWPIQLVFERAGDSSDLLSAASLRGQCELAREAEVRMLASGSWCHPHNGMTGQCCGVRSLGSYAARLAGKSDCASLDDSDAASFVGVLNQCKARYASGGLQYESKSWDPSQALAGDVCTRLNAVFDSFNALIDRESVEAFASASAGTFRPRYTKVMLPFGAEPELKQLHSDLLAGSLYNVRGRTPRESGARNWRELHRPAPPRPYRERLRAPAACARRLFARQTYGGEAKLTAYELANGSIKMTLFSEVLFSEDMPLIAIGICIIVAVTWLYTGSLCFTLFAYLQIFLAIGMAFGVYSIVLFLPFFPFINMTGTFLCIGIGADDIFVVVQAFDDAIRHRGAGERGIDAAVIQAVLLDAGAATLVTSLTTAGAFFASAASSITAIKCFGVFCGLVVLTDWLVMVLFIPPLAVLYQRFCTTACCKLQAGYCPNTPMAANDRQLARPALGDLVNRIFGPLCTHPVLKFLWVLAVLGLSFGMGAQFIADGFQLPVPSTSEIQMLKDDSGFERYCCVGPKAATKFTLGAPGSEVRQGHLLRPHSCAQRHYALACPIWWGVRASEGGATHRGCAPRSLISRMG